MKIENKYFADVHKRPDWLGLEIYLAETISVGKMAYHTIDKDGCLIGTVVDQGSSDVKPLFKVTMQEGNKILQALADALSEAGYKIKVDNEELAKQTALAEERLRQLEYYKGLTEKMLSKKELI